MVGTLAYIYEEQVESELKLNLNSTFLDNYKVDTDKTKAIDDMQLQVRSITGHWELVVRMLTTAGFW